MELNKGDVVAMHDELSGEDAEGQIEAFDGQKALVNFGFSKLWLDTDRLDLVHTFVELGAAAQAVVDALGPTHCAACDGSGKETTKGKAADGCAFTLTFERPCPVCGGSGRAA